MHEERREVPSSSHEAAEGEAYKQEILAATLGYVLREVKVGLVVELTG